MEYLRCLLPKGYPTAPPTSPSSSCNTTYSTSSDLLVPPNDDRFSDADLPPFVPDMNDHTSLNQMDVDIVSPEPRHLPRLYKHPSTSTLRADRNPRPHTDPVTPATAEDFATGDAVRRRSSVPASILRKSSRSKSTASTPSTSPSVRFYLGDDEASPGDIHGMELKLFINGSVGMGNLFNPIDGVDKSPNKIMHDKYDRDSRDASEGKRYMEDLDDVAETGERAENTTLGYESLGEGLRIGPSEDAASSISANDEDDKASPNSEDINDRAAQDDDDPAISSRSSSRSECRPLLMVDDGERPPMHTPVPSEIRVRKPTVERIPDTRRKSMPTPQTFWVGKVHKTVTGSYRQPESVGSDKLKSDAAQQAMTHTYIHKFLPDEAKARNRDHYNEPTGGQRRLKSTHQVVRSRDSVYEVVWEDSMTANVEDVQSSSELGSSSSASPNSIMPQHSPIKLTTDDIPALEHVNTKLTAWSWESEGGLFVSTHEHEKHRNSAFAETGASPSHSESQGEKSQTDRPPTLAQKRLLPLKDDTGRSSSCPLNDASAVSDELHIDLPAEVDDSLTRRRNSNPTSAPTKVPISPTGSTSVTLPSINAKSRRELLGNRKMSNYSSAEERFGGHRDSLILAHKRIFHDSPVQSFDTKGHDPRLEALKRSTWTRSVEEAPSGDQDHSSKL